MVLRVASRQKKRDISSAAINLSKSIVGLVPGVALSDPATIAKATGSSISSLIDFAVSLGKDTSRQLDFSAWDIVRATLAHALVEFFGKIKFENKISAKQLENLIALIIERSDILLKRGNDDLSSDSLIQPLLIPTLRDATKCIALDVAKYNPHSNPDALRKTFEVCLFNGFVEVRNKKPDLFKDVETALTGTLSDAIERRNAQAAHQAYLARGFTQTPIFGQELTGLTISDLYVRQRSISYYHDIDYTNKTTTATQADSSESRSSGYKKTSKKFLHVGLLHDDINAWLQARLHDDPIRVIAGGPGSGKSTFARALAIEIFDKQLYDVLFINLQDIPSDGSFDQRIGSLFQNRTELGFDRIDSPLNWLGRSKPDGSPPLKPLLLLCDGLDEIAPPESREAANATTDFIQALSSWIINRNSAGCYVKCIVLGRNNAAEEAFRKLNISLEKLIHVGGLRPLTDREDWQKYSSKNLITDALAISSNDQRVEYWANWANYFNLDAEAIPEGLQQEAAAESALQELTAEPLLLYLLLWTGYLKDRWQEAAKNRNVVYQSIFEQIYRRDWGSKPAIGGKGRIVTGGHVTTSEMKQDDFMLLQEALGLSAWPSGGRIVSIKSFDLIAKLYLPTDLLYDFNNNNRMDLKSVAVHSYTRGAESEDSGFEFVHKSLGEYLIGRGLVGLSFRAIDKLAHRAIDPRCLEATNLFAGVACQGTLTNEIARFFHDEMILRLKDTDKSRELMQEKCVPLLNWTLHNQFPIKENVFFEREVSFFDKIKANTRALDALWYFSQCLAQISYSLENFESEDKDVAWSSGPVSIAWPSPSSFNDLFLQLTARFHTNEAGRISTFDRINFKNQLMTDISLGSVQYDEDPTGRPTPKNWLSFTCEGSYFSKADFYSSYLHSAKLSHSVFDSCSFYGTRMINLSAPQSHFIGCEFNDTNFLDARIEASNFTDCKFEGIRSWRSSFDKSKFEKCKIDDASSRSILGQQPSKADIVQSSFVECEFKNTSFGSAILKKCDMSGATLENCSLLRGNRKSSDFSHTKTINVEFRKHQFLKSGT